MSDNYVKTNKLDSAYRLVIVAAKRSKELQRGAEPRVESPAHKPTTIAIQEVRSGKVDYAEIDGEEAEAEQS